MNFSNALKELKKAKSLNDGKDYFIAVDAYTGKCRIEIRSKEASLELDKDPDRNKKLTDWLNEYDITKDLH